MKLRKQFTAGYEGTPGPSPEQTLVTQPDMTMSIRDLLDRHSRGLPLTTNERKGEYFDTEIPRFYDLTDMLKYKQELMDRNKSINNLIKDEKKAAKQREKENLKKTEDLQTSDKNETLVN
jgi:pyruvate/2-oxoacid:ferredoxin oxidoreductase beta subunit